MSEAANGIRTLVLAAIVLTLRLCEGYRGDRKCLRCMVKRNNMVGTGDGNEREWDEESNLSVLDNNRWYT